MAGEKPVLNSRATSRRAYLPPTPSPPPSMAGEKPVLNSRATSRRAFRRQSKKNLSGERVKGKGV